MPRLFVNNNNNNIYNTIFEVDIKVRVRLLAA